MILRIILSVLLIILFMILISFIARVSYLLTTDFNSLSYEDQKSRTILILRLRKLGIVLYK
jgi:hypothetical protein